MDGMDIDRRFKTMAAEITSLAAETMALQLILSGLMRRMEERSDLRPLATTAFNDAANIAEQMSIMQGPKSGHMPRTLRMIEQLRVGATGGATPKHGV